MDRTGIDLGALRVFRTVAEMGTVTAAADKLSYVQSNVTARLRRLEEALGTALFHRQRRGMTLTPAGEVLFDYAYRVLGLVDEACLAVGEAIGAGATLRIGAMESTAAVRLPAILAALHRDHPNLQVDVSTGPTDPLLRDVLSCRLDGAFVGALVNHPNIICESTFMEQLGVISSASGNQKQKTAAVLIVFRPGCPYRAHAERWLRERGMIPYRMMELGTLDGILGCVAAGMGIAVLPRSVVDRPPYRDTLAFAPLPRPLGQIPTMFIRRRDAPVLMSMRWFMDAIAAAGRQPAAMMIGKRVSRSPRSP